MRKIGIVGYGHVGKSMKSLFPKAIIYDEPLGIGSRDEINNCTITFICVPTPESLDGQCDTSVVENVISWVESQLIVIRSTVPVGFTSQQETITGKNIVFQPEYYGETVNHPFSSERNCGWITLGGRKEIMHELVLAYEYVYPSEITINIVDSKTAELAKYMENCFLATKVTFCNEFFEIATAMNIDYPQLRETWLLDPRIGRSHTFVYADNRGFNGSCLPKDLDSMIYQAKKLDVDCSLLDSVRKTNAKFNRDNNKKNL